VSLKRGGETPIVKPNRCENRDPGRKTASRNRNWRLSRLGVADRGAGRAVRSANHPTKQQNIGLVPQTLVINHFKAPYRYKSAQLWPGSARAAHVADSRVP